MRNNKEIIREIIRNERNRVKLFRNIKENEKGLILLMLPRKIRKTILLKLKNDEILNIIHYLDLDEVTDLLQELKPRRREKILSRLSKDMKNKIEFLLKFDPRTAAGVMNLNYIEVEKGSTFKEVIEHVKKHERKTGKFPTILIVENGYLLGELPGYLLTLYPLDESVDNYIKKVPAVKYNEEENIVLETFKRHRNDKVVVLNDDDSIIGIIYSDDVLDLMDKKYSHVLGDFAGVSEEEDVLDNALTKVKYRYKWLIINLGTAFLAASVVGLFKNTISKWVLLAAYMPVVAGMGGNAATQTLAVVVRGMALNEINTKIAWKVILNEMIAGVINGVINGIIVAIIATLFNHSPLLGVITGLAMIINLIVAGLFGALIPMIMKSLGKDPASSATIFITTATDVCGFFVFLGLASLIL